MFVRRIADYLVYLVVRIVVCVIQALRIETCQTVSRAMAKVLTDVIPVRHQVIDDNLAHAFPEMSARDRRRLTRRMWEHLFLMLAEIAHAPRKIHTTNWRDYIELKNSALIIRTMFDERPTVYVSAHFGNFELAGVVMGIFGFRTYTVARPLDNPYLDRFINSFRGSQGQHILPKDGTAQEIDRLLTDGGALVVLADHHAGKKGCWVEFFGRMASTHKAVAIFSLTNDAPLLVSYARRLSKPLHYDMGVQEFADPSRGDPSLRGVQELTQWYTNELEQIIRRAPQQYWWIHRRWKDAPQKRRRKPKAKAA